jgi:2-amino-4-hydroxy-6-hydroxymethyldihydropteridine diphosphokinase
MSTARTQTAYIGLGSNLASFAGPPIQTIHAALNALAELGEVNGRSSLYETAPVGFTDQPPFVNAVAAVQTIDAPEKLLERLLEIERRFGRDRTSGPPKGPRTLDLDLLLVDDLIVNTPSLTLPHPALAERRFVLAPLAEIAPQLLHPQLDKTLRELLQALPDSGDNRIAGVRLLRNNS